MPTPRGPGRTGSAWRALRLEILAESGGLCALCHQALDLTLDGRLPQGPTVDHVVPLVQGGDPTDRRNLQAAHKSCNSRKENQRRQQPDLNPSQTW